MENLKTSETTLFFNTRDEMVKVKLSRVAFFEADSNYCNIVFINGAKATILTSLANIEKLLCDKKLGGKYTFVRIGRRYVVNLQYIFQINILKQKLILSDFIHPNKVEIMISKEALKKLKELYTNKSCK